MSTIRKLGMQTINVTQSLIDRSATFNPFSTAPADWIEQFLLTTCADGLSTSDRRELEDQIEALVPAVVELRDAGHVDLNARAIASFGTLDGFMRLAADTRLSELARARCEAIRTRLIVHGVRALLGH